LIKILIRRRVIGERRRGGGFDVAEAEELSYIQLHVRRFLLSHSRLLAQHRLGRYNNRRWGAKKTTGKLWEISIV